MADDRTSNGMAYDDLGAYGRWENDQTYGQVWVPNEAPGWSPYTDGRWVWEGDYGWTWLSYEPWGWAPYHYGRWFYGPWGWCWYPPGPGAVAVWSPGFVAFVGFGGGYGLGYADFGWIPLGPYDPWVPWYGWYGGFFGPWVVNDFTYINITNIYVTRYINVHRGVITVPRKTFFGGGFERGRVVPLAKLGTLHEYRGGPPFAPEPGSLRFSERPVPAQLATRSFPHAQRFAGHAPELHRTQFSVARSEATSHIERVQKQAAHGFGNPLMRPGREGAAGRMSP